MNTKLASIIIAGAMAAPMAAQAAGSFTVANQNITLSGGVTGAYVYTTDNALAGISAGSKQDVFAVPDALIDLSSEAKTGGLGFTAGLGNLAVNSIYPFTELSTGAGTVGVQYGWLTVKPMDNLTVQAGKLATNVGYEVSPSYLNGNFLRGLVFDAQPTYYTGARVNYSINNINVYAEANKGAFLSNYCSLATCGAGGGIGASTTVAGANVAVNFFTITNVAKAVDIIASTKVRTIDVAFNIDFLMKADAIKNATPNTDDSAVGFAIYASMPVMPKVTIPVRLEYVSDGTSDLYGLSGGTTSATAVSNSAITLTVSPTYHFSDSTFVRAELAYVSTDKKLPYVDDKGKATDSSVVLSAQAGVLF